MTSLHHRTSRLLRLAAVGTALAALSACGGPEGADAPKDASVEDFCNVIGDLDVSDPSGLVDDMAETGTPDGIPADAREGFEVMIDEATADDISAEDQDRITAFIGYVAATCTGVPVPDPTGSAQ